MIDWLIDWLIALINWLEITTSTHTSPSDVTYLHSDVLVNWSKKVTHMAVPCTAGPEVKNDVLQLQKFLLSKVKV